MGTVRGRWWFRTTDLRLVRAKKATLLPSRIQKTPRQMAKTIRRIAIRSHPFVCVLWNACGTRPRRRTLPKVPDLPGQSLPFLPEGSLGPTLVRDGRGQRVRQRPEGNGVGPRASVSSRDWMLSTPILASGGRRPPQFRRSAAPSRAGSVPLPLSTWAIRTLPTFRISAAGNGLPPA